MKLSLPLLLTLGTLLASVVFALEAKPQLGEPTVKRTGKTFVQVYVEENFKGRAVRLDVPCALENDARLREVGIQNDSIQSLKIPDGVTITLYAAAGFGGESASFTGKAATLGALKGQTNSLKAEVK